MVMVNMSSLGSFFRRPVILVPLCISALFLFYITSFDLPANSLSAVNLLDLGKAGDALKHETGGGAEAAEARPAPSLQALCGQNAWQPNLTLHCHSQCGPSKHSICGGLNNARDRLQTCVRLAIDAGATTVLIPSIAARSQSSLWVVDPTQVPGSGVPVVLCADAWFSVEKLRRVLGESCPQLRVEDVCPTEKDAAVAGEGVDVVDMPWRKMGPQKWDSRLGHTFREAVGEARAVDQGGQSASSVLVRFGDPYVAWNYTAGGEQYTIFKDLFRTIDYNPELLALGRRITTSPSLLDTPYAGVHMRAENDWPAKWGSLEEQTEAYAAELRRLRARHGDLRTVYVSCGNRTAIQYFREVVEPIGFSVLDKWAILEKHWPEGLEKVEALPFDQKAIVEYAPLMEGKFFFGLRSSSMSVVIAQARTLEEEGDFFEKHVDKDTTEVAPSVRTLEVRGNEHTRFLVIRGGGAED